MWTKILDARDIWDTWDLWDCWDAWELWHLWDTWDAWDTSDLWDTWDKKQFPGNGPRLWGLIHDLKSVGAFKWNSMAAFTAKRAWSSEVWILLGPSRREGLFKFVHSSSRVSRVFSWLRLCAWEGPQLLLVKVKNASGRIGIFQVMNNN